MNHHKTIIHKQSINIDDLNNYVETMGAEKQTPKDHNKERATYVG
jgi:hypothetical protein